MSNEVHIYTIDEMLSDPAMVTDDRIIVPPVGTLFDCNGTTLEVKLDKEHDCTGCYFTGFTPSGKKGACFMFPKTDSRNIIGCTPHERESEESVIFVEKGGANE